MVTGLSGCCKWCMAHWGQSQGQEYTVTIEGNMAMETLRHPAESTTWVHSSVSLLNLEQWHHTVFMRGTEVSQDPLRLLNSALLTAIALQHGLLL
eukprot:6120882-Amphidinium_carterae.1